jgi:hypothetical protein
MTQHKDFKDINREVVAKLLPRATKIGMDMTDVDAIVTVLEECFMAAWSAALASQGDEIKALKARYNVLFELYADHIHDHRLGAGKACDGCKAMIDAQIDAALEPGCLDSKKASKFDPDGSEYEEESYQTGG